MRNVTYGWQLNGIGSVQGSLPLMAGAPPIRPGEHALIVERDGLPVWMGPFWPVDFDTGMAYLTFHGSEWASYLRRRRIRVDRSFSGWDQFDIARWLIQDSQEAHWGYGDLHIDVNAGQAQAARSLSGVTRDRNYIATDRKELWEALVQLGDVIDGFDQRLRPVYAAGEPRVWWEGFYPRQGPTQERLGLVLEYREGWPGSNVTAYRWRWTADEMANVTDATGDEAVASAFDASAWVSYPVLEAVDQRGGEHGVTQVETLQEHADALLRQRSRPMIEGTLTLKPGFEGLGPDLIGAQVRVRLTSWRHPPGASGEPGFDQVMRIEEISVQAPSDERPEQATVTLGSVPWWR